MTLQATRPKLGCEANRWQVDRVEQEEEWWFDYARLLEVIEDL